jgi:hypothetical protein
MLIDLNPIYIKAHRDLEQGLKTFPDIRANFLFLAGPL